MNILFLFKNSGVERSPAVIEIIKVLTGRNIKVDLVLGSCDRNVAMEEYYLSDANVTVSVLSTTNKSEENSSWKLKESIKNILEKIGLLEASCIVHQYLQRYKFLNDQKKAKSNLQYAFDVFLTSSMKNFHIKDHYDYIWTVDEYGLLWAEWLNQRRNQRIKIIHHSLELYWEHFSLQKHREWRYYREYLLFEEARKILIKTDIILIQDEARWKVLAQYTGLRKEREKIIFPLSMKDYKNITTNLLYKIFKLKEKKKIIFYPTLIAPKRGCLGLVKLVNQLDKEYAAIIHGFCSTRGYVQEIERIISDPEQIIISETMLDYQELTDMHQDIWCVFLCYGEKCNNDRFIANSSNKLVMSLQAGKPIITIGNQMLADLCNEYMCGKALKSWSQHEFKLAVEEMDKNYDLYCQNARKCFQERFDINLYAGGLFNKLVEYL